MSNIVDFKILSIDLYKIKFKEAVPKFNDEVNSYLQRGYTLHGTTLNTGINWVHHKFIQAVVKYSAIPPGPVIKKYHLLYVAYPSYPCDLDQPLLLLFEKSICDQLHNGYTFHGDMQYLETGRGGTENNYSQAFVQISNPNITTSDIQTELLSHNKALLDLRLEIENQGRIIRKQNELIDKLTNPVKPVVFEANLLDI
jgi:hypothetical protein